MQMSYVQIHEDTIKDLLTDCLTPRCPSITLREHPSRGVYMENARQVLALQILYMGEATSSCLVR